MESRVIRSVSVAFAAVVVSAVSLAGQTRPALPGAEAVKSIVASQMEKNWTVPKTP